MSLQIETVAKEIEAALTMFTADGYAEDIGFDAGPAGIWAEQNGPGGEFVARYKITFTIEEEESN